MAWHGYGWRPYVSVAQRRRQAQTKMAALRKKGIDIQPVEISGRTIARTFWGKGWCDHLESFSDYDNRLPRGRTYVRNGSVCHLGISRGEIEAKVAGSEIYNLVIKVKTLPNKKWGAIKGRCAGQVGSLIELLQGRLSDHVMEVVTDRRDGLFPLPGEISFKCDCPDWAIMCKHVAAVLYGVGARLDESPELLFQLRGVDHEELIAADAEAAVSSATTRGTSKRLATDDLSDVFGIDIDTGDEDEPPPRPARKRATRGAGKTVSRKKSPKKRAVPKKVANKSSAKKKAAWKSPPKKKVTTKAVKTAKKTAKKKVVKQPPKKKATKKKGGVKEAGGSVPKKKAAKKKGTVKKAARSAAKKKTVKRATKKAVRKK